MKDSIPNKAECCGRGGARPGCGRKPGIKTKPVRLPVWLLEKLAVEHDDVREAIISACLDHYGVLPPANYVPDLKDD